MKHEIIYTDDYALIVSDEEIEKYNFVFNPIYKTLYQWIKNADMQFDRIDAKKVIAHRPLTGAPILEGVPLLPEFSQGDDVKKIAEKEFYLDFESSLFEELGITKKVQKSILIGMLQGTFSRGYSKAKKTYKYTEDDLVRAIELSKVKDLKITGFGVATDFKNTKEDIIQSLQQTKRPRYFQIEMLCYVNPEFNEYPKTTINSRKQTELVGEYIYN